MPRYVRYLLENLTTSQFCTYNGATNWNRTVPPPNPSSDDLFIQEREIWRRDPHAAFDGWLVTQRLRQSSADVYRAQWGAFLEWITLRRKDLISVDTPTIAEFAATLPVRKPQRVRYLRLIERVLDHVRAIELASTNPARFIAQDGEASWRDVADNEPTSFLSTAERAALVAHLFSPLTILSSTQRWRERRDRALTALFLGGGVKTGEAAKLAVSCVAPGSPWVTIESPDPQLTRRTRLSAFAVPILDAWLAERRLSEPAGTLVFPASAAGRPMHKATMLRAVDAQIEACGIADARAARASPHTLRNSFAADLFESGVAPELVGQWLGFVQPISANRLHRAWKLWADKQQPAAQAGEESKAT